MEPTLKFNVRNQNISRIDNFLPVRYSRNYLYAAFDFKTEDWAGRMKTALFKGGGRTPIPVVIGETDTCLVPWEALEYTEFTVTVFSGDLITVDSAPVKLYESGYRSGDVPDPTPTIFEQVMQSFDETKQYASDQAELSKRYAVGSLLHPGSETDNAKYYANLAENSAMEIPGRVEAAKEDIDDYVRQKEHELKGETGNVYFAAFKVVNGRLKMYSDPDVDKVRFKRKGSRLTYSLNF